MVSSIKANIGHTKAAAGIAGLIKATMALHTQILPPMTGCEQPHSKLTGEAPALRVLNRGEPWTADRQLRAGVSAMGFGGINTHVVLEGVATERRQILSTQEQTLLTSTQDAELLMLDAEDTAHLLHQVEHLFAIAPKLSRSELTDLAAGLERNLDKRPVRAAIVAATPKELETRLEILRSWLQDGLTNRLDSRAGVFLGKEPIKLLESGFSFRVKHLPSISMVERGNVDLSLYKTCTSGQIFRRIAIAQQQQSLNLPS